MPYIDSNVSVPLTKAQEILLKTELGKILATHLGKSENFLMINFSNDATLYFQGNPLEKGAFIEIKIFGNASASALEAGTAGICTLYNDILTIPPNHIYVRYAFSEHWGWNGQNF